MRSDSVEARRKRRPIRTMCRAPRVSAGGYYDWRGRPECPRAQRREAPVVAIEAAHSGAGARYGSPRVRAESVARGTPCSVNTAAPLMRRGGIVAETKRKFRCTTDSDQSRPVAESVPGRQFEPEAANRAWTADITYIAAGEGRLCLAAVEDPHPRKIVGWSMGSRIDGRLVADALEMAATRRLPGEGLVVHSGRGSRYAGEHYQVLLTGRGIVRSMSRRANRRDNAPMESFFASPKEGLIHDGDYAAREGARASIFEHIEVFFDRIRRHSSPGHLSPAEYERAG
jgi:putative transposase